MSWLYSNPAILNIVNKNCKNPQLPCFNNIVVDGETYAIKGDISHITKNIRIPQDNDKTYLSYKVLVSGELTEQKGCMPNPMALCPCIILEDIKLI